STHPHTLSLHDAPPISARPTTSICSGATHAATSPHSSPSTGAGRSPEARHPSTARTAKSAVRANWSPSRPGGSAAPTRPPAIPGSTQSDWQVIAIVRVRGPVISLRRLVAVIAYTSSVSAYTAYRRDRKSTRLNSSHVSISYDV